MGEGDVPGCHGLKGWGCGVAVPQGGVCCEIFFLVGGKGGDVGGGERLFYGF